MTQHELKLINQYDPCFPGLTRYKQHATARDAYYGCNKVSDFTWLLYNSEFDDIHIAWELTHIYSSWMNHDDIRYKELAKSTLPYRNREKATFLNDEIRDSVNRLTNIMPIGRKPYLNFAVCMVNSYNLLYNTVARIIDHAGHRKIMPFVTALLPYERLEQHLFNSYQRKQR